MGFKEDGDRNDRLRQLVQGGYYERPNLNPSRGGADIRHNGRHRRPAYDAKRPCAAPLCRAPVAWDCGGVWGVWLQSSAGGRIPR